MLQNHDCNLAFMSHPYLLSGWYWKPHIFRQDLSFGLIYLMVSLLFGDNLFKRNVNFYFTFFLLVAYIYVLHAYSVRRCQMGVMGIPGTGVTVIRESQSGYRKSYQILWKSRKCSHERVGNALTSWTICPGFSYGLNYVAHKNRPGSLYLRIWEYLTI